MRVNKVSAVLLLNLAAVLVFSACATMAPRCASIGDVPVCGPFLDYYRHLGEGPTIGYPLAPELQNGDMKVQYFENAVIQYPVTSPRFERVHLRPLGTSFFDPMPFESPLGDPDCVFFDRHGHHVCGAFYDFFIQNGGERVFGPPISNVIVEGGTRTQLFENVKFIWEVEDGSPHVELDRWGELACLKDGLSCAETSSPYLRPDTSGTPMDEAERDLQQFVAGHGGREVFGEKIGDLVFAGDLAYQYHENICLTWTPGKSEPVALAPLGVMDALNTPPIAPPPPSDDVLYFPETGHSIILAFRDYYLEHGGRSVFGLPLTEFMEVGGLWFQWFENARFEWRPDLPNGQRVQLTPLGEINNLRLDGGIPPLQAAVTSKGAGAALPPAVLMGIAPQNSILPLGESQRVHLFARDAAGQPLPNVTITLYVTASASQHLLVTPPTDGNGDVWINLAGVDGACTEVVELRAVTEAAGSKSFADGRFTLWCAPDQ